MTMVLVLVGLWLAAAFAVGLLRAPVARAFPWALIALGVPLLGLLTLTMGPVWGMGGLIVGAVALRRPVLRAGLWHGPSPRPSDGQERTSE